MSQTCTVLYSETTAKAILGDKHQRVVRGESTQLPRRIFSIDLSPMFEEKEATYLWQLLFLKEATLEGHNEATLLRIIP